MKKEEIVLGTSALLLTFRCNLQCKLCCTMTPFMPKEKQVDFPLEDLKAVVKRYFEVAKYIGKLSFGGGEPTLYKNLPELIEYTIGFKDQYEVLEIITNAAAVPRKEVLDVAEKYKDNIFFMIDNYGKNISKKVDEVSKIFTERGIRHTIRCYHGKDAHSGGWVDLGDFSHKHTAEEARELLKSCTSGKIKNHTGVLQDKVNSNGEDDENTFFIAYAANTNGLIHRCARAYSTLQEGALKDTKDCFVNIMEMNKSVEEVRREIIDMFMADDYLACEYCNGFSEYSVRYEPAEQIIGG